MIDAGPTTGTVTLTAYVRCCDLPPGTPQAGVQALVIQPDGRTGAVGTTDAQGEVALDGVEPGAGIAAIYTSEFDFSVVSFLAVQPGDHLIVGENYYTANVVGGTDGTMAVTFPTVPGASAFYAYHPCGADAAFDPAATAVTINLYAYCQSPTATLELVTYDPSFNIIQSGFLRAAPFTPGSVVALPAWQAPTSFTIDVSGLPAAVEYADLYGTPVVDGGAFLANQGVYGITPVAGAATGTFDVLADSDRIGAHVTSYRSGFGWHDVMAEAAPTATGATMVDPGLPWLGEALASGTDQTASWLQESGAVPGDGAIGFAWWSRFDPTTKIVTNYRWVVVMPPGLTEWSWPAGPTELAPYRPEPTDAIDANVIVVDIGAAADYDAVRAIPEWVLSCPGCATDGGELPAGAAAAYTYDGGEGFAPRQRWRRAPTRR
jgi:hypothetical protein